MILLLALTLSQEIGFVDSSTCDTITGWAASTARLNESVAVELREAGNVLATVTAASSRPDVGAYLKDNGLHGFTIAVPAAVKTGAQRSLNLYYAGTSKNLGGSPLKLTCAAPAPIDPAPIKPESCSIFLGVSRGYNTHIPVRAKYQANAGCFDNQFDADDAYLYLCVAGRWKKAAFVQ